MPHVQPVQTLDLPELAPYRTMRWQNEHRKQGIFVAEGEKVVRRLLESDLEVISLLLPEKWLRAYSDLLSRRAEKKIQVFTAEKALLEKLTGFSMYQGVLAVARVPRPATLDVVLKTTALPILLMAVDGLSSAENLGGLVRSCVAFGVNGLLLGETSCSPYLRRAVRSSMGAIFKLPVIEATNLQQSLSFAKKSGLRIIAAHPHTTEAVLSSADFRGSCIIVMGSEGAGISPAILDICDQQVLIPMQNNVDSLNVGTAGAVFLYEAMRQRQTSLRAVRSL
jgi:tRNA G18 (ribose-2'-O)-methylase SpoU